MRAFSLSFFHGVPKTNTKHSLDAVGTSAVSRSCNQENVSERCARLCYKHCEPVKNYILLTMPFVTFSSSFLAAGITKKTHSLTGKEGPGHNNTEGEADTRISEPEKKPFPSCYIIPCAIHLIVPSHRHTSSLISQSNDK